jgi:hypothetical protein
MGARLLASSPEETLARLRKEQPMWAEMIQISGAKAE